jgi:co-chaperonin GroES (HSP10)
LKPFLDVVSVRIVKVTAQSKSGEGSRIAEAIDEKLRLGDVVFLGEAVDERRPQKSNISDVRTRALLSLTPRN